MKILSIIILILLITGLAYFFYLGFKSHSASAPGLVDSRLTPCSDKPNCICTEYPNHKSHYINAIEYNELNLQKIIEAIQSTGGIISNNEENYIAATYTSSIFRYVDDFELRIDTEGKLIHIRSASRVGHSDMGVNLKRIETFKATLKSLL
ncbi:MAG: DUF1499 domain-containing protein [Gammaproteobacteria bacterium]|nr:DUF1499 domain-containing protein [Gammaproteobacteria bacterium]